jgi:hypothetical protein
MNGEKKYFFIPNVLEKEEQFSMMWKRPRMLLAMFK